MSARLLLIGGALAASLVAGTVRDRAAAASRVTLNGYHVLGCDECAEQLRAFNARGRLAAIGDTDAHGIGQFGVARTYVFARERSAESILEAVRAGRTVVYDRGRAYGDATLVQAAAGDGRLPRMAAADGPRRLGTADGAIGIAALLAAVLFGFRTASPEPAAVTIT